MANWGYYSLLEVDRGASPAQIRDGYKAQALRWHPDRQPADQREAATGRFKQVAEAYSVLREPGSRAAYDRSCATGLGGLGGGLDFSPDELFREVFGDGLAGLAERVAPGIERAAELVDGLVQGYASSRLGEAVSDSVQGELDRFASEAEQKLAQAVRAEQQAGRELREAREQLQALQAQARARRQARMRWAGWSAVIGLVMLTGVWRADGHGVWRTMAGLVSLVPLSAAGVGLWRSDADARLLVARKHLVDSREAGHAKSKLHLSKARARCTSAQQEAVDAKSNGFKLDTLAKVGFRVAGNVMSNFMGWNHSTT